MQVGRNVPERERLCIFAVALFDSEGAFFAAAILTVCFDVPACADGDIKYMYKLQGQKLNELARTLQAPSGRYCSMAQFLEINERAPRRPAVNGKKRQKASKLCGRRLLAI